MIRPATPEERRAYDLAYDQWANRGRVIGAICNAALVLWLANQSPTGLITVLLFIAAGILWWPMVLLADEVARRIANRKIVQMRKPKSPKM